MINTIYQFKDFCVINGEKVIPPKPFLGLGQSVTQLNDKIYINGREYKNGKFRTTLPAIYYYVFN